MLALERQQVLAAHGEHSGSCVQAASVNGSSAVDQDPGQSPALLSEGR